MKLLKRLRHRHHLRNWLDMMAAANTLRRDERRLNKRYIGDLPDGITCYITTDDRKEYVTFPISSATLTTTSTRRTPHDPLYQFPRTLR